MNSKNGSFWESARTTLLTGISILRAMAAACALVLAIYLICSIAEGAESPLRLATCALACVFR